MKKEEVTLPQALRSKEVGEGLVVKRVLGNRVLVDPIAPKTELDRIEASGLALPQGVKEKYTPLPATGIIVGVGDGVSVENQEHLKFGTMVLFDKHAGSDWFLNKVAVKMLNVEEILCTLEIASLEEGEDEASRA